MMPSGVSGVPGEPGLLNEVKTQLIAREGVYRLVPQADYGRPKPSPYAPSSAQTGPGGVGAPGPGPAGQPSTGGGGTSSSVPLVRLSFTKLVMGGTNRTPPPPLPVLNHDPNLANGSNYNGDAAVDSAALSTDHDLDCPHSNLTLEEHQQIQERICFNTGRELFINVFNGLQPSDPNRLVDRKTYKSTSPTCHDFCTLLEPRISLLLVGFLHGQIQLIDMYRAEISQFYNQERLIDKSKVTCIRWLPRSRSNFLVAYSSGQMYLYKEDLPCFTTAPIYQQFKSGDGFAIYTCKTRSPRNPIFRWSIGAGAAAAAAASANITTSANSGATATSGFAGGFSSSQSAINEMAFSPCGQYLAIVSQDGFLRVFHYDQMELVGMMRSYFGGLLCLGWSPDSKFLVTGGEDDLITVWSLSDKRVIARGQGHKSWVNSVVFDRYMTTTRDSIDPAEEGPLTGEANASHQHALDDMDEDETSVDEEPLSKSDFKSQDQFQLLTHYRIGSVGQDTQICLWDLTDDIIRQATVIKSRSRSTISQAGGAPTEHRNSKLMASGAVNVQPTTGASGVAAASGSSHNFFNSLKKGAHKKNPFSLSSRSFLEHAKNKREPDSNGTTDGGPWPAATSTTQVCDSSRVLGTALCPRLKDVPILEPHVCKKISHERLTSLVFRRDALVVANHDAKILVFSRPPVKTNHHRKMTSPNGSQASDGNDISHDHVNR